MTAVLIALLFGLAVMAGGVGVAGRLSAARPPFALGAAVALGTVVILGADLGAFWRFEPLVGIGLWIVLLLDSARTALSRSAIGRAAQALARSPLAGLLAAVTIVLLAPLLVLPVPLDTDAQGFGMLALAMREGATLNTLGPWRPDIAYLYSPGALMIFAWVSSLAPGAIVPDVMMATSHAAVLVFVWLAWELGEEIADARSERPHVWPWAMSVSGACSIGLWTALLDSHYTAIFGLLFVLAFVTATFRYLRTGRPGDLCAATISLAAIPIVHADCATVVALGLASLGLGGLIVERRHLRRWLAAIVVPPLAALVVAGPWLVSLWPLVQAGVRSPYEVSPTHWRQFVLFHGMVWPLLALIGALVWIRLGRWWAVAMVCWMAAIVELSTVGWIERALPAVAEPLVRFNYPYSLAWHGPVVPYLVLGGGGIAWALERAGRMRAPALGRRALAGIAGATALGVALAGPLLRSSKSVLTLYGAFSSANDIEAMRWVRDHTTADARVLNYPGDVDGQREWEAHWAPVVTERDCVYFRMQLFFADRPGGRLDDGSRGAGLAATVDEQQALLPFWRDPANPANAERLAEAGIDYVLVPESVGDPSSLALAWRWQPPARLAGERSAPEQAGYLRLVYRAGGAQVFQVSPDAGAPQAAVP